MLDINLFRVEKGNDPEIIRESQRLRFPNDANVANVVDEIIKLDKEWRQRQHEVKEYRTDFNKLNKRVAKLKISGGDATKLILETEKNKRDSAEKEAEVVKVFAALKAKLETVGNLVQTFNNNEKRFWGEKRFASPGEKLENHVDLIELLGIADTKAGAEIAGSRCYFLDGDGVLLNQALISFGLSFLKKRGFTLVKPPSFMTTDVMAKCAQLAQFDEELYKVTGEGDDKYYLIATAEQPLCARHANKWMSPTELPIRYAAYSPCFRKEAGSHGRDTRGIFRVHEFEKIEQFCITSPNEKESSDMLEEMLKNSEDFYQALKLPYQIVPIDPKDLNDAAAKKYDLEAWFPASETYRELVSCSNCTDYQSRRLKTRFGQQENNYVHMLNSTLTATERTICCILENYQREDGVDIPEVLQPFMGGVTFLPFKTHPVVAKTKAKKSNEVLQPFMGGETFLPFKKTQPVVAKTEAKKSNFTHISRQCITYITYMCVCVFLVLLTIY